MELFLVRRRWSYLLVCLQSECEDAGDSGYKRYVESTEMWESERYSVERLMDVLGSHCVSHSARNVHHRPFKFTLRGGVGGEREEGVKRLPNENTVLLRVRSGVRGREGYGDRFRCWS
ncbi:hypothetical protein ElyMa_003560600 [Elysia marginata]|uniref:Uncharacterized protein n=1 Tax=Elysia marginata TaxID=1093978 RepID=A0AAV4ELG6_9GAST|nr:hypothetical protein ElyMa_003560600 [Elysia marginata]